MSELIKIEKSKGGKNIVSAKELYDFLGLDKSHWSRWCKKNIEENDFALENVDYQTLAIMANGNETKDFAITLDLAKKLAMMSRTKKGEEIRNYFLECEKRLSVPSTFAQALKLAYEQQLLIEEQQTKLIHQEVKIKELKPKADYCDIILSSEDCLTITQIAKDYGFSGRDLNSKLHELGVQYKQSDTWLLYGKYDSKGYTKSETIAFDKKGKVGTKLHTKWTQKGRLSLYNILKQNNILPLIEQENE